MANQFDYLSILCLYLYVRAPHRDVLAVRGLAQRGKLSTNDSVLNFLARLGDNGVVWHVLEYWRATN